MELLGAISSREWNSLNGFFSSDHYESNHDHQSMNGHNFLYDSAIQNYDINPLGTTECSNIEFPLPICTYEGDESYSYGAYSNDHHQVACVTSNSSLALCDEQEIIGMRSSNADLYNLNVIDDQHYWSNQQMVNDNETLAKNGTRVGNAKKRSRSDLNTSSDHLDKGSKSKRNIVRPRKNKRRALSEEERDLEGKIIKEPIGHEKEVSEDIGDIDSCSSQKHSSTTVLNLSGKSRASRGSATDPQSLYARRRREKINERLRTLQNLVPNGTKVDISTMLEDAVQYVKFLQLQIKLLSSDDLWMYAPLAYNGMNVGINLSLANPNQNLKQ